MDQSKINEKLYKSRKNILIQLKNRGYNVDDYENFSINEIFIMNEKEQMDMLLENPETKSKTYVKYLNKPAQAKYINEIIEDLFTMEAVLEEKDDLIIISNNEPNEVLLKYLISIWDNENKYVAVINIDRLQYNVLDHIYVPHHRSLTIEESDRIRTKFYVLDDSKLPSISRFDPCALAIALRPSQMCEILRPSPTAKEAKFYRICVNKIG